MITPSARRLIVNLEFPFGSTVHLRLRQERMPGMVTGFIMRATGLIYVVAWGDGSETDHFEIELTAEYTPDYEVNA